MKAATDVFAPTFERAGEFTVFVGCRLERTLERSRCRIVDRPDEAGHVAGGGRLAPAILDAAARFAFEIDDGDVVLDDQHLPEMKIAVMTDLHRVDGFREQFAQSRGKPFSIGQKRVNQLPIVLRQVPIDDVPNHRMRGRHAAGRLPSRSGHHRPQSVPGRSRRCHHGLQARAATRRHAARLGPSAADRRLAHRCAPRLRP